MAVNEEPLRLALGHHARSVPIPGDALIIVPVRNTVLFPGVVAPITIARPKSIAAAQQALREQRPIGILLQRDTEAEDPRRRSLPDLHGRQYRALHHRAGRDPSHHLPGRAARPHPRLLPGTPFPVARVLHIPEPTTSSPEIEARFLNLQRQAVEAIQLLPQAPPELVGAFQSTTSPAALADLATSYMDIKPQEKQEILETVDLSRSAWRRFRAISPSGSKCCG